MLKTLLRKVSVKKLNALRYPSGAYAAAKKSVGTGYDKAWIRDNIYIALGLENAQRTEDVRSAYHALFDMLKKHEYKIDWAIREKPDAKHKYIHARFCPQNLTEFWEEWGNKQNDAVGAFLYKVGDLHRKGITVVRDSDDYRILQKLVWYLQSVEYWQDKDNGVWEENEEVHASSVGACVAGLLAVKSMVDVPSWLIRKGRETLDRLLPRESVSKETDMALLSLIYPYNIVNDHQRDAILRDVEQKLVRKNGVIRYRSDHYYNSQGREAEWVMGFPWLAVIYRQMGDRIRYYRYLAKTIGSMNLRMELPELYFGGTGRHNENTPLGWSHAMLLAAIA